MKREILFRAQRIDNGKLIEGQFYHSQLFIDGKNCNDVYLIRNDIDEDYFIKENTVCQFTGLTDKNGTKVFENDKINVHENVCGYFKDWTARVDFIGGCFCLVDENDYPICSLFETCGEFEVIGNIFDNSELLK